MTPLSTVLVLRLPTWRLLAPSTTLPEPSIEPAVVPPVVRVEMYRVPGFATPPSLVRMKRALPPDAWSWIATKELLLSTEMVALPAVLLLKKFTNEPVNPVG